MKNKFLPPTYLNFLLLIAIGLHFVIPTKRIISPSYSYVGVILILLGVILNVWSGGTLRRANTTIDFNRTPKQLVTDGPFRFSRNPIYLSGVILSLGFAIALGSLIMFIYLIALFIILNWFYIPFEERRLENEFGQNYHDYKRIVRRWI
jgi:protein-S-isoprenylcysteine O-methyltransferase Ste14